MRLFFMSPTALKQLLTKLGFAPEYAGNNSIAARTIKRKGLVQRTLGALL